MTWATFSTSATLALFVVVLTACQSFRKPSSVSSEFEIVKKYRPAQNVRGIWIWGSQVVRDRRVRNELFALAIKTGINTFYVESESLIRSPKLSKKLAQFIQIANKQSIQVELLFGAPAWARAENHNEPLGLAALAVDFIRRFPSSRPSAIHFDIEPHTLSDWQDQNLIAKQFLDLLEGLTANLKGEIPLVVDIPHWYDGIQIERSGEKLMLSEAIIERVDAVTIMAYLETSDRVVNSVSDELEQASSKGKSLYVGVEAQCSGKSTNSFCKGSASGMLSELQKIETALSREHKAFSGTAIHHYKSFRRMRGEIKRH